MYIDRHLESVLTAEEFLRGVMAVTGSRQTGKSTLIEHMFADMECTTVVLDDLDMRAFAKTNPKLFIAKHGTPLFIDEVQYAPELFSYMKIHVDKTKERGAFYLTGSQRYSMMKDLSDSLAGRVGIFELLGLSLREIKGDGFRRPFVPTEDYLRARKPRVTEYNELWELIHKGAYPELYDKPQLDWNAFYNNYVNTYIERDVRRIENIGDEVKFYQFMQMVAANSGNLFNVGGIAKELGISHPNCESWLSVLRASNLIYLLPPYHSNVTKRAVKTPKIYFLDTGLMAFLTKWHTPPQIETGAMSGAFFETFVFCEILKSFYNAGVDPRTYLYFYRDKDGNEIDFVVNYNGKLHPIEVKKNAKPNVGDVKAFRFVENGGVYERGAGAVICTGDMLVPLTENDTIVPFNYI
ncbi:MAG: ATP-binding protein [Clostridiales Family XIII bacterium]|jgi:predicted AAA+ superfamily ATPase|nr:ATP-binding protein [Clostridiales Family XIII bacterium]